MDNCAMIIQARMSSHRFPGKMMADLCGMPLIKYVYMRLAQSGVKNIMVATSVHETDDPLYSFCRDNNIPVMRGSLLNVLDRYIQAAVLLNADYIVRVCGDTPFVDTRLINNLLDILIKEKKDLVTFERATCSSGFFSEAFTLEALKKIGTFTDSKDDLEHVTRYMYNNPDKFSIKFISQNLNPEFMSGIRLTIDYPEDMYTARKIVDRLSDKFSFSSLDVLNVVR